MAISEDNSLQPASPPDWATLAARFLEDLSKMMQAEIRLAELGLRSALQSQVDQLLAMLAVAGLLFCAVFCILAAVVLLLHHWMEWWAAFALTAVLASIIAISVRAATSHGSSTIAELRQ